MSQQKLYDKRCPIELDKAGGYFARHMNAMTAEGLHSKSDIAMELGYRDKCITELQAKYDDLQTKCDKLLAALKKFTENSSIQTNYPYECEFAEMVIEKAGG